MRTRLILAASWISADSNRARHLMVAGLTVLALCGGLLGGTGVALAGNAPGGSH